MLLQENQVTGNSSPLDVGYSNNFFFLVPNIINEMEMIW